MSTKKRGLWTWFKRHIGAIIVVILAAAGVMAISAIEVPREEVKPVAVPSVPVDVMPVVRLTPATAGPQCALLCDSFELLGTVRPNRTVDVCAEVAATVESLPKEKGQTVAAGDLLVVLNTDLLQADLNRIQATLNYNRTDLDRLVSLQGKGHATQQEADVARTTLEVTRAELSAAQARLKRAKIYAPFAGVLNERSVEVGAYLAPGMRVGNVVDMSVAKVCVDVSERDIGYVKLGQETDICADVGVSQTCSAASRILKGKVTYISQLADDQTHTTQIEISVPNAAGELQSGQMVKVRLVRRMLDQLVLVPLGAIIPMENDKCVYIVETVKEGKTEKTVARQRIVTMGAIKGAQVQVLSGLSGGERLILPGGNRLVSDGQKVEVNATTTAPAGEGKNQ